MDTEKPVVAVGGEIVSPAPQPGAVLPLFMAKSHHIWYCISRHKEFRERKACGKEWKRDENNEIYSLGSLRRKALR